MKITWPARLSRTGLAGIIGVGLIGTFSAAVAQDSPTKVADVVYGPSSQLLDVFVPAQPAKHSALLFIHGGGFKQGSKDDMAVYAYLFAQGGFVAATMDYRLTAAGYTFPAPLEDVRDAIRWLKQKAGVYGFDARKIILVGYSAGGNLALMAGLTENSGVAAIASAAGPTDLTALIATATLPQIKIDMDAYLGGFPPSIGSPINLVRGGNPPVLLLHGDKDNFVPLAQSQLMLKRLNDNHVPASLHVLPNAGHEIMLLYKDNPSLKPVLDDITRLAAIVELQP
jgi:acetyl esterase/lipase